MTKRYGEYEQVNGAVCNALQDHITELEASRERLLMDRARQDARLSVFMGAIASESRKGRTEWAVKLLHRADVASLKVKRMVFHHWEDLVTAHFNSTQETSSND